MPTNPWNIHEAFTLLVTRLLPMQPHYIRYEADEADWRERIEHLQRIASAFDAYLHELGRDCAQHAHCSFDLTYFRGPLGDVIADMVGQMERATEAARQHEATAAE